MRKISIVIPALNEEKYIPSLLASLKRQTMNDFEVIVADAGSRDETRKISLQFGAYVVDGGKPAVGRNRGAAVSRGDFIFFLDADVVLPDDFCECVWNELRRRRLKLATCEVLPLSSKMLDKTLFSLSNVSIKLMQYSANPFAPGCCIIIHRNLFERVGGFDESLYLAEDHEFAKRAVQYSPLRVLNSTYIMTSVRRLRKEGRFSLAGKYIQVELHRIFNGEIRQKIFDYDFGAYNEFESSSEPKALKRLYEYLQKINISLNKTINKIQQPTAGKSNKLEENKIIVSFREKIDKAASEFYRLIKLYTKKSPSIRIIRHYRNRSNRMEHNK